MSASVSVNNIHRRSSSWLNNIINFCLWHVLNCFSMKFDKFFPFLMTALILGINFHCYGPYINLWVSILEFDLVSDNIWRTKLSALFLTIAYGFGPRLYLTGIFLHLDESNALYVSFLIVEQFWYFWNVNWIVHERSIQGMIWPE